MTGVPTAARRVYLDNAATTWPKCAAALDAAEAFQRTCGATSGRGAYTSAMQADRWLVDARAMLASLIHAPGGNSIAITNSGTHALNAALWGVLRPGDHVISSGIDHNSLLRPLRMLEGEGGIAVDIVSSDGSGFADPQQARGLVRAETKWIAVGHASNVTGRVQDMAGWSELAREVGAKLLVDASQTLGYLPIDVAELQIDILAAAGHKGLRALQGTGLLYVHPELLAKFRPLMFGGTGLASEQLDATPNWPQSVEVGNLNMPGVVSMAVAATELLKQSESMQSAWQPCFEQLVRGLSAIEAIRLVGMDPQKIDFVDRIPVVSLTVDGWDVHDLAGILDSSFGIEARAGWHCAALVHASLGTENSGGTLRLSPGVSTTSDEIDYVLSAFREILYA